MPLSLSTTSGSQKSIEGYMGDSIFIDEAEVIEVINRSGSKKSANQGWVNDLQIEVNFRLLKNDWERTFNIGGNFRKEFVKENRNSDTGNVTSLTIKISAYAKSLCATNLTYSP